MELWVRASREPGCQGRARSCRPLSVRDLRDCCAGPVYLLCELPGTEFGWVFPDSAGHLMGGLSSGSIGMVTSAGLAPASVGDAGPVSTPGNRTMNAVRPGRLSTDTEPWCPLTTAETMASPSPVLPAAREREESPRANRSNTLRSRSAGMPGPLSTTDSTASLPGATVTEVVTVVPGGVWVRALLSRLASAWCSRCTSPV